MRFAFWIACVFAFPVSAAEPVDALAELNADRAKHGLYPYVRDEALTQAAATLATYRAEHRMSGHVRDREHPMGDFSFLVGLKVDATGCAAWADGFGACEMRGSTYKTAGAAKVRGADGLFYCHLVLRKGPPTTAAVSFTPPLGAPATPPKEYPVMGGFGQANDPPNDAAHLDNLNVRLLAAERWGAAGGYRAPVPPSKPLTVANIDQRLRSMEQFGIAMGGYRPKVKPDATANVANLEQRLRAAETFGQGMGYVPPVQPFKASVKPVAASSPANGADVAVCVQRDSTGKILREWTEPAGPVRAKHGIAACTGCVGCQCQPGDCAGGKCPAVTVVHPTATRMPATIQGGCPNGNCPNVRK